MCSTWSLTRPGPASSIQSERRLVSMGGTTNRRSSNSVTGTALIPIGSSPFPYPRTRQRCIHGQFSRHSNSRSICLESLPSLSTLIWRSMLPTMLTGMLYVSSEHQRESLPSRSCRRRIQLIFPTCSRCTLAHDRVSNAFARWSEILNHAITVLRVRRA